MRRRLIGIHREPAGSGNQVVAPAARQGLNLVDLTDVPGLATEAYTSGSTCRETDRRAPNRGPHVTTGEQPRLDQDEADTFTEQEPWLIAVHDKRSDVIGQRPSTLLGVLLALLSAGDRPRQEEREHTAAPVKTLLS